MINIRDYKTKIIDGKTYIGIEIENKDENYYNNKLNVEFLKDGEVVKKETIIVPLISGDDIAFVGETYDFVNYDDIKISLETGIISYEESYYPDVKFELDHEKTNNKHLEYKVENNSSATFAEVSLNLVFYNRGELVCGTKIKLENVMTGRVYYFVYDIPSELEYTDINTALVLPNSNHYLFKGFYEEYKMYEESLEKLERNLIHREHVEFVDDCDKASEEIKKWKNELKKANKMKSQSEKWKNYFKIILLSLLWSLLGIIIALPIAWVVGVVIKVMSPEFYPFNPSTGYYIKFCLVGMVIVFIAAFKAAKDDLFIEQVSDKMKQDRIKECEDNIKELEKHIADITANKDKYIKETIEENKKIDEYNAEMTKIKNENDEMHAKTEKMFEDFKAMYPKYRIIENYDAIDRGLVDAAIAGGAITFDSVELYRRTCREKIEADEKFERQMKVAEEKNRLLAEQNQAIRNNTEQQAWDAMQARAEAAKQARAHDALVLQQIAQNDKLYRQKEYYSNQMSSRIDELRNENYLNGKYL